MSSLFGTTAAPASANPFGLFVPPSPRDIMGSCGAMYYDHYKRRPSLPCTLSPPQPSSPSFDYSGGRRPSLPNALSPFYPPSPNPDLRRTYTPTVGRRPSTSSDTSTSSTTTVTPTAATFPTAPPAAHPSTLVTTTTNTSWRAKAKGVLLGMVRRKSVFE